MDLERVELRCYRYLGQAANPLVPIARLLQHVREDEECGDVSEHDLLSFLRRHEMFKVIEPLAPEGRSETASELAELGIATGPRAILRTRVPTKPEIGAMFAEQFSQMSDALSNAYRAAVEKGNAERGDKILSMLARIESLQKKLKDAL
jgi:hypothetical protein